MFNEFWFLDFVGNFKTDFLVLVLLLLLALNFFVEFLQNFVSNVLELLSIFKKF